MLRRYFIERQEYGKIEIGGPEERNVVTVEKQRYTDKYREYNRLRMRGANKRQRQERKLSRFIALLTKIREYENEGLSDDDIVKQLADHFEYRLIKDKDKDIDRE